MRDNHEGMIEFIDAYESDGHYFAVIGHLSRTFQFGVSRSGYRTIRKAMQVRPFDMLPGLKYRYFYNGSHKAGVAESYSMTLRVELGRDATSVQVGIPKDLHANLLWFQRLQNVDDAA